MKSNFTMEEKFQLQVFSTSFRHPRPTVRFNTAYSICIMYPPLEYLVNSKSDEQR